MKVGPLAEKAILKPGALAKVFSQWAAQPADPEALSVYTNALGIPFAAHNSFEALKSYTSLRPSPLARRFTVAVRTPISVPALQLQGAQDGCLRKESVSIDSSAFCMNLRYETIADAGYFLTEEAPTQVNDILLDWLKDSVDAN